MMTSTPAGQPEHDHGGRPPALGVVKEILIFVVGVFSSIAVIYGANLDYFSQSEMLKIERLRTGYYIFKVPAADKNNELRRWACEMMNAESDQNLDCAKVLSQGSSLAVTKADLTDFDVFVCNETPRSTALADETISVLNTQYGRVRMRGTWSFYDEIPLRALSGKITLVYDDDHPEHGEVDRVRRVLLANGIDALDIVATANPGPPTPWYLSVIVCPD